ncbi:hypothetical protein [Klebsiella pneumoniae]|uniref:hypothetical protein n=1 Tax=Klebsiella pneumoniae TaxID=573 RepID=UPI0021C2DA5D|nr:hypothetical protein [Klebsiella pneumoniae]
MGEYQMTNNYGLKTPEQWQQESILALLFHYDHVEACFMADAIKVLPEDHDVNRAEEYLESLIEWLAGYTDESEVRKAIECYSIKGSEEQTAFFLGAILGDEY